MKTKIKIDPFDTAYMRGGINIGTTLSVEYTSNRKKYPNVTKLIEDNPSTHRVDLIMHVIENKLSLDQEYAKLLVKGDIFDPINLAYTESEYEEENISQHDFDTRVEVSNMLHCISISFIAMYREYGDAEILLHCMSVHEDNNYTVADKIFKNESF